MESLPMLLVLTQFLYSSNVIRRYVRFVLRPVVPGKFLVELVHHPVPRHLGYHRGSSYGGVLGISLDYAGVRDVRVWFELVPVYYQVLGHGLQGCYCEVHRLDCGIEYVHGVYLRRLYRPDAVFESRRRYENPVPLVPRLRRHLLRIIQFRVKKLERQDHGGGDYGSRTGSSPRFVDPGLPAYLIRIAVTQHWKSFRGHSTFATTIIVSDSCDLTS